MIINSAFLIIDKKENDKEDKKNKTYCKLKKEKLGSLTEVHFNCRSELMSDANVDVNSCDTIKELIELCTSLIFARRMQAIQMLVDLISNYQKGFHDDMVDIPIVNILFLLRSTLDDYRGVLVEKAAMGLAFLFYNESDQVYV